jgi:hypothetical protein
MNNADQTDSWLEMNAGHSCTVMIVPPKDDVRSQVLDSSVCGYACWETPRNGAGLGAACSRGDDGRLGTTANSSYAFPPCLTSYQSSLMSTTKT